MKVLPGSVTIGQVMNLAVKLVHPDQWKSLIFAPAFFYDATLKLPKREGSELLVDWLRKLIGPEVFDEVMSTHESPQVAELKVQFSFLENELKVISREFWNTEGANFTDYTRTCEPLAKQKADVEAQLAGLNVIQEVVVAKALELWGVDVPDKVPFDYKVDTLVWRQQVGETLKKFGVEELILLPVDSWQLASKLGDSSMDDAGKIAIARTMINVKDGSEFWQVVAILSPNGDNSGFFKTISRELLGKDSTSDGINAVSVYVGEELPVVVSNDVIR